MAGGKRSRRRCAAGSVGSAAVIGKVTSVEAGSTKRKAVAGRLAPPLKECATGRKAQEEAAGAGYAATAVAVADDSAAGDKEKTPRPANRMSMREIRWILNHKPSPWPSKYQELKERNPSLIPPPGEEMGEATRNLYFGANAFYRMDASFPKLQQWIRHEMETKGYVEMDDDWVRRRAETDAMLEECRKKIEAMVMYETQEEDDDDESDYDDDDEF